MITSITLKINLALFLLKYLKLTDHAIGRHAA
jgi:hypothetical protein